MEQVEGLVWGGRNMSRTPFNSPEWSDWKFYLKKKKGQVVLMRIEKKGRRSAKGFFFQKNKFFLNSRRDVVLSFHSNLITGINHVHLFFKTKQLTMLRLKDQRDSFFSPFSTVHTLLHSTTAIACSLDTSFCFFLWRDQRKKCCPTLFLYGAYSFLA